MPHPIFGATAVCYTIEKKVADVPTVYTNWQGSRRRFPEFGSKLRHFSVDLFGFWFRTAFLVGRAMVAADDGAGSDGGSVSDDWDEDDEGEEGSEDGDADHVKRRVGRGRRSAARLNLISDPEDVIVELDEATLEELAANKKLSSCQYPTYIFLTHPNFQLRLIDGLSAVKGSSLKERRPHPTPPYPTLPHPNPPYPTLPYPTLPHLTLPYPTLSYPTLRHASM